MNSYNIWSEGYSATGQSSGAVCLDRGVLADTFDEACIVALYGDPYFNENSLTYWGCKLYDNEYEARGSFG
jgi:hypothetical protein